MTGEAPQRGKRQDTDRKPPKTQRYTQGYKGRRQTLSTLLALGGIRALWLSPNSFIYSYTYRTFTFQTAAQNEETGHYIG